MYLWQLVGHSTSEGTLRSGLSEDLAGVMRLIEGHLVSSTGFFGHIVEAVPRMSVFDLDLIHVPTGREWRGYRDNSGGVHWEQRYHPADPDVVYEVSEYEASENENRSPLAS